ncbi:hypothetical protein RJ640_000522 [Escallonia rubra]|uniref:MBD domain-containing protein n=1 Tax=Escallonia rubra TaxID=112253 RepID=A0AA88QJL1_9ASTE|nr:hypothetical protein RJ640_000522 [Escallonia rubra]
MEKYYFEPTLGKRFRSKKEVLYFLETGSKRKKRSSSDADAVPSDSVGGHKEKKSKTKSTPATLNFDFRSPPKSVSWVLTDESEDKWAPQVSDENVPESTKQEWATVFEHICHS